MMNSIANIFSVIISSLPLVMCNSSLLYANLSETDRQTITFELLRLLEQIQAEQNSQRLKAIDQLRVAQKSLFSAYDFYEKCISEVLFEKTGKSSSEFREWRKINLKKHRDPSFRKALQLQLRWLEITLLVSSSNLPKHQLVPHVRSYLKEIFDSIEDSNIDYLNSSVLDSIFAYALSVNDTKIEKWCNNPLDVGCIYDMIILPYFRESKDLKLLRQAWEERLNYEEILALKFYELRRGKSRIFYIEQKPVLIWKMLCDFFANGDTQAPKAMLKHVQENISHPHAQLWLLELKSLISKSESRDSDKE